MIHSKINIFFCLSLIINIYHKNKIKSDKETDSGLQLIVSESVKKSSGKEDNHKYN